MADTLPESLVMPTRTELVRRYERDYRLWRPDAKVGDKTQVNVDARVVADVTLPLYARADRLARLAKLEDMTSEQLEDEAARVGIEPRLPATGGSGFVKVSTSVGGAPVLAGDQLTLDGTQIVVAFTQSGTFTDGAEIGVTGVSTGPDTNLPPGTVLKIANPRPGMGTSCTVVEQETGVGLKGGHDVETDAELVVRIRDAKANPPASGNDSEVQQIARETPDVPVGGVFSYAAFGGPGTTSVTVLLRPPKPGASRLPDSLQLSSVYNRLRQKLPVDFSISMAAVLAQPVDLVLLVSWSRHSPTWEDASPWPKLYMGTWSVAAFPTPTATSFRLTGGTVVGGGVQEYPPSPGNTIGFYDTANGRFVRKKVLTVTASGADVDVTCDITNNASDMNYVPAGGERMVPWSDSLQSLVAPALDYFDSLGPGEMFGDFFDAELRQRRSPPSPDEWPANLSGRLLTGLYAVANVSDVAVSSPSIPFAPSVGAPGSSVNLLTLDKLLPFPAT